MEKASAHWISPSPISFLCFCSKAKGNYRSSVIIGISIGNNFYFPVKRWGLKKHGKQSERSTWAPELTFSFSFERKRQKTVYNVISHLNRQWGGGIDEGAPGQPAASAGVSQEGDRSQVRGEHTGSYRWKHSWGAPGNLLGLHWGESHLTGL